MPEIYYCEQCGEIAEIERPMKTGRWRCSKCKGKDVYKAEFEIKKIEWIGDRDIV